MDRTTTKLKIKQGAGEIIIELNDWINGREAEYIQQPLLKAVKVSGANTTGKMGVDFSPELAIQENNHREIESFVVKVTDGTMILTEKGQIRDFILDEMQAKDYETILDRIKELQETGKKK